MALKRKVVKETVDRLSLLVVDDENPDNLYRESCCEIIEGQDENRTLVVLDKELSRAEAHAVYKWLEHALYGNLARIVK